METPTFLNAYTRDLTPHQIHGGMQDPAIRQAQLYSYHYGQLLYDALRGGANDLPDRSAELANWEAANDFREIEDKLFEDLTNWPYRPEINFYGLNTHMRAMWYPLIHGGWPKKAGTRRAATYCMKGLALDGLTYYAVLEDHIRQRGTETLYTPSAQPFMSSLQGCLQEIDATIAILNWVKHCSDLTVVPAPAQFEHSEKGAVNADLLVIDFVRKRTLGIQIKNSITAKQRQKYDPRYIELVGAEDLGNTRIVRTQKDQSAERVKAWPGIIAASHVLDLKIQNNPDIHPRDYPFYYGKKHEAKQALGDLRVDYQAVSKTIGKRILEKL